MYWCGSFWSAEHWFYCGVDLSGNCNHLLKCGGFSFNYICDLAFAQHLVLSIEREKRERISMAERKNNSVKKETTNKDTTTKNPPEKSNKDKGADTPQTEKSSTEVASNAEQSESSASKKENYVRGESQKPVTKAYRNNWNRIFK